MDHQKTFSWLFDELEARLSCSWATELEMQDELEKALIDLGIEYEREASLDARDRVDFMIGPVAVELKIKGALMDIYRQIERYAAHDRVKAVVLITPKNMDLPEAICGKPAFCLQFTKKTL
jgi:hypothetical protein